MENGKIGGVTTVKCLNKLTQNLAWLIMSAKSPHIPKFKATAPVGVFWQMGDMVFYSARNARIASAVLATAIPSVCPSVCHTPVLCQNDGT